VPLFYFKYLLFERDAFRLLRLYFLGSQPEIDSGVSLNCCVLSVSLLASCRLSPKFLSCYPSAVDLVLSTLFLLVFRSLRHFIEQVEGTNAVHYSDSLRWWVSTFSDILFSFLFVLCQFW